MKNLTSIATALLLASAAAQAGEPATTSSYSPAPSSGPLWNWFVGGSVGYLFDNEEEFYTLHFGAKIAETGPVTHSLFLEGAYAEFSTFGVIDTDVIPVTLNYKADYALTDSLSLYAGLGLGGAFIDSSVGPFSDDSVELTGQIFAGLGYDVTETFEIYGGARWIWVDDTSIGPVSVDLGDDVGAELGLRFKF
jgi:opacity protein-like surface antigen